MRLKLVFAVLAAMLCAPLPKAADPVVIDGDYMELLPLGFTRGPIFEVCDEYVTDGYQYWDQYTLLDEDFKTVGQFDTKGKELYWIYVKTVSGMQSESFRGLYNICGPEYVYVKSIETQHAHDNYYYDNAVSVGCSFVTLNNEEVGRITFPDGYYTTSRYMYIYVVDELSDKKYYAFQVRNDKAQVCLLVYTPDAATGFKQVAMMPVSKVSPTAPMRGENVTVTLDEEMAANGADIKVVAADGQTMISTKVSAGQSSVNIPTKRLKQGVYVVTVGDKEATKIIIR